jgi:hypothetical protein
MIQYAQEITLIVNIARFLKPQVHLNPEEKMIVI